MTAHRHSSGEPDAPDEPDEPGIEAARARPFGRYSLRASVGLGAVGLLAGLLFSTSASLASDSSERRPENLRDLVRSEQARLAETNAELEALRNEVADLYAEQADPEQADPATAFASGTTAVQGPGLVVRL